MRGVFEFLLKKNMLKIQLFLCWFPAADHLELAGNGRGSVWRICHTSCLGIYESLTLAFCGTLKRESFCKPLLLQV